MTDDVPRDVALRDYMEALLSEQATATRLASDEREKAASALRDQLTLLIATGDASLREHISNQIGQIQAALAAAERLEIARIDHVEDKVTSLRHEREARTAAVQAAVEARIDSVQRELTLMASASDRAILKAETGTEKRFESVNEFRAQLAQVISQFLPREVADTQNAALDKRLAFLEREARFDAGRQKGVGVSANVLVVGLGALATIIGTIIVLANVLTGR